MNIGFIMCITLVPFFVIFALIFGIVYFDPHKAFDKYLKEEFK